MDNSLTMKKTKFGKVAKSTLSLREPLSRIPKTNPSFTTATKRERTIALTISSG